ncbi:response regulator [bacterium]|nr:response regulator [bacterium]
MKGFNILFVDDEPDMLEMLSMVLKQEGTYTIFTASDGEEALALMEKVKIELILSDNKMPKMQGIDLLKKIKSKYPDTMRILMTGFPDINIFKDAINEGEVYKIITKPLDIINLNIVIKRALEHYESIQENKRLLKELEKKVIDRTKELKQSELKYSVLIENAAEGIYLLDTSFNIIHINISGIELNGFSCADDVIGMRLSDIVDDKYKDKINNVLKGCSASGKSLLNCEYRSHTGSGKEKWRELNVVPIKNERDEIVNFMCVARDTSERKKYEEQVARLDRLASLGTLSAGIAHEIQNPLSFIKLNLQTIDRSMQGNSLQESVKDALVGIGNIEKIIKDTLTFAKPAAPRFKKENIGLLIESVLHYMKPEFIKKRISIERETDEELPRVVIDPNQIMQVFINLLSNSLDAVGENGRITIRTLKRRDNRGDYAVVIISDNGGGIPEEKMKYIFDPFFTTKAKGTGLGLSIVQNIIKMNNANISVESELNKGTSFTVEFPLGGA